MCCAVHATRERGTKQTSPEEGKESNSTRLFLWPESKCYKKNQSCCYTSYHETSNSSQPSVKQENGYYLTIKTCGDGGDKSQMWGKS